MLPVLFADQDLGSLSPVHSFTVILLSFSEPDVILIFGVKQVVNI